MFRSRLSLRVGRSSQATNAATARKLFKPQTQKSGHSRKLIRREIPRGSSPQTTITCQYFRRIRNGFRADLLGPRSPTLSTPIQMTTLAGPGSRAIRTRTNLTHGVSTRLLVRLAGNSLRRQVDSGAFRRTVFASLMKTAEYGGGLQRLHDQVSRNICPK